MKPITLNARQWRILAAAVAAVAFAVVELFFPGVITEEGLVRLILLFGAYVGAEAIEKPAPDLNLFKSTKFIGLVIGLVVTFVQVYYPDFVIPPAVLDYVIVLIAGAMPVKATIDTQR